MFRLLGSTTEPMPQSPDVPLTIHGQYVDAELPRLIAAEKPDVLLFPAQVPETYAYTLSVALASGLPIVASALGAFPERLAGRPRSATVPWNAPPAVWNERAARGGRICGTPGRGCRGGHGQGDDMMDPARYVALYLAPLLSTPRARDPNADIPPLRRAPLLSRRGPGRGAAAFAAAALFRGRGMRAHRGAPRAFKRRVAVVDKQLEEFRAIRDRAQGDREHLAAELLSAQRMLLTMQIHTGHVETSLAPRATASTSSSSRRHGA